MCKLKLETSSGKGHDEIKMKRKNCWKYIREEENQFLKDGQL